jgi:hypothetical protein
LLSDNTARYHREISAKFGFVINLIKTREDFFRPRGDGMLRTCLFNINSELYELQHHIQIGQKDYWAYNPIGYFNLSLFFGRNIKESKSEHDRQSIGDEFNKMLDFITIPNVRTKAENYFNFYHDDIIDKFSVYKYYSPETGRLVLSPEVLLYLPPSMNGVNLYQGVRVMDIPLLLESIPLISFLGVGRFLRSTQMKVSEDWSKIQPLDLVLPLPGLRPAADIHSEILIWITKSLTHDMTKGHRVGNPILNPNWLTYNEIREVCQDFLTKIFRNFTFYNFNGQRVLETFPSVEANLGNYQINDLQLMFSYNLTRRIKDLKVDLDIRSFDTFFQHELTLSYDIDLAQLELRLSLIENLLFA